MQRIAWAMLLALVGISTGTAQEIEAGGVVVFGGAGRTGAKIVDLLLARGEPVTVFVRPTTDRSRLADRDVAFAVGDARNREDVDAAIKAAKPRVIINAVGGRRNQERFWDRTQMNMTAAGKKYGAEEIIFLSSVGVGDSAIAYSPEALERSKVSLAERFTAEEDLKASGLDYVIIRTGIVAPEGTPATGNGRLTEDRSAFSPITRSDLARLTVNCISNPECRNKTFATMDDSLKISR